MKFRTYDKDNIPQEKIYGLFMEHIPIEVVNIENGEIDDGDIFIPEENKDRIDYSNCSVNWYCELVAKPWGENGDMIFKLYTDDAQHYYTESDLKKKFIKYSI